MTQPPTIFQDSPSDRMQVLGVGELPTPGVCIICGAGDPERKYVFLGVHLDFLGALLLCDLCLTQSAEKIGCMAPTIAEMIHVQSQQLATDLAEAKRTIEAQNDRLSTYASVFRGLDISALSDGNGVSSDSDSDESLSELPIETAQSESTEEQSESDESSEIHGTSDDIVSESGDLTAGSDNSKSDESSITL